MVLVSVSSGSFLKLQVVQTPVASTRDQKWYLHPLSHRNPDTIVPSRHIMALMVVLARTQMEPKPSWAVWCSILASCSFLCFTQTSESPPEYLGRFNPLYIIYIYTYIPFAYKTCIAVYVNMYSDIQSYVRVSIYICTYIYIHVIIYIYIYIYM